MVSSNAPCIPAFVFSNRGLGFDVVSSPRNSSCAASSSGLNGLVDGRGAFSTLRISSGLVKVISTSSVSLTSPSGFTSAFSNRFPLKTRGPPDSSRSFACSLAALSARISSPLASSLSASRSIIRCRLSPFVEKTGSPRKFLSKASASKEVLGSSINPASCAACATRSGDMPALVLITPRFRPPCSARPLNSPLRSPAFLIEMPLCPSISRFFTNSIRD